MSETNLRSINSCIELSEIRKLDKLLSQCEANSCENILFSEFCSTFESIDQLTDFSDKCSLIMDRSSAGHLSNDLHHSSTAVIGAANNNFDELKNCHCPTHPNCRTDKIELKSRSCTNLQKTRFDKKSTSLDNAGGGSGAVAPIFKPKPSLKKQTSIDRTFHHHLPFGEGDSSFTRKVCKKCGKYTREPEKIVKIKSTEIDIKVILDNPEDVENDDVNLLGGSSSKYSSQTSIKEMTICNKSQRNSLIETTMMTTTKTSSSSQSQLNNAGASKQLCAMDNLGSAGKPSSSSSGRSRSKFSPQILAKKIARKSLSGNGDDNEKSAKESLLGHTRLDSFHIEKKLPETVETVRK